MPVKLLKGHRSIPARYSSQVTATQQLRVPSGRGLSAQFATVCEDQEPLTLAMCASDTMVTRRGCSPVPHRVSSTRALWLHENASVWEGAGFLCCLAIRVLSQLCLGATCALGVCSQRSLQGTAACGACRAVGRGLACRGCVPRRSPRFAPYPRTDQPGCDSSACLGCPG